MPTIEECIKRVNGAAGLSCDECHGSTKIVSKALAGIAIGTCESGTLTTLSAELDRVAQTTECRVYRVDIEQLGHSFAVAQCGGKIALMQSWIFAYDLQEWMTGTDKKFKGNKFLPSQGPIDHSILSLYLRAIASDFKARKSDYVLEYCLSLFSPDGKSYFALRSAIEFKQGADMSMKWQNLPMV